MGVELMLPRVDVIGEAKAGQDEAKPCQGEAKGFGRHSRSLVAGVPLDQNIDGPGLKFRRIRAGNPKSKVLGNYKA